MIISWPRRVEQPDPAEDTRLAWVLRSYAGARLSPDQWASVRMRRAVMEHGRASRAARAALPPRVGWVAGWTRGLRPAAFIGLVGALAVMTGAEAAVAASAGGPLYGARVWVETAVVTAQGGGADLRVGLMNERIDEITAAVGDGNPVAATAAGNAYSGEAAAAAQAANDPADLLALQAALQRHVNDLQSISQANPKVQPSLDPLIARMVAALAQVNDRLAGGQSGPAGWWGSPAGSGTASATPAAGHPMGGRPRAWHGALGGGHAGAPSSTR